MQKKKLIYFLWHILRIFYLLLCLVTFIKLLTPYINKYYLSGENFLTRASDSLKVEDVSLVWDGISPKVILYNVNLENMPHPQVEHVAKIFAVVDIWKSLLKLNLDLSDIVINDIVINVDNNSAPKAHDIHNLHELLASICRDNLNFYLENVSIKNLLIKYQDAKHTLKLKDINYISISEKDQLNFKVENDAIKAQAELTDYKDNLGSITNVSYNFKSSGKYPEYLFAKIDSRLKNLSGELQVNYHKELDNDATIRVSHDLAGKIMNKTTFDKVKGTFKVSLKSYDNYEATGSLDLGFNGNVLKRLKYNFKRHTDGDELRLQNIDLKAAKGIASLLELKEYPRDLKMAGVIKDLYFGGDNFITSPLVNVVRANVSGLKISPWHNYPGVDALDVKLKYLDGVGEALVSGTKDDISIELPEIFEKKLHIRMQKSDIKFAKKTSSVWLLSLPQLALDYNGNDISSNMDIAFGENISANGSFTSKSIAVSSLKELLAAKPLNRKLSEWLKSSVRSGVLVNPVLNITDNSKFNLKGDFVSADLSFAKNWPQLKNAKGSIYLDNDRLEVLASAAMQEQSLDDVKVTIADLHHPDIEIAARSKIDLAKGKNIVDSSPLSKTLGKYFSGANIEGNANLSLDIMLSHASHFKSGDTKGQLALNKNSLSWPGVHFGLTNAEGSLFFHNFDISSSGLKALYHNDIVNLDATSSSSGLSVSMHGALDANAIAKEYLPEAIAKNVSGKSNFNAVLKILPGDALAGSLDVNTSAKGIAIAYPAPLGKKKSLKRPVAFNAKFTDSGAEYQLNAAPEVKFTAKNKLGSIDVYLNSLNIDLWDKYFKAGGELNVPKFNIFAKELIFKKEVFKDIKVALTNKDKEFGISIDSKKAKGDIIYKPQHEVEINLGHLYLSEDFTNDFISGERGAYKYNAKIKKLSVDGYDFNGIETVINSTDKAIHKIDRLKFSYEKSNFDLKGRLDTSSAPNSILEGKVGSEDFSEIFTYIPSLHNFNSGSGEVKLYITWPDLVNKFSAKLASATFDINIIDSEISDIGEQASKDLAASKILNFLSMRSIIDNFARDDDDASYIFDEIKGNLVYSQGVLNTEKIDLKGDFGSAYVIGDINLNSYSYDLYMTVLPIITSSIPTIAALAGGVFAGFIAWTANQIVEAPISEIAKKSYRITGPIEEPMIVELEDEDLEDE